MSCKIKIIEKKASEHSDQLPQTSLSPPVLYKNLSPYDVNKGQEIHNYSKPPHLQLCRYMSGQSLLLVDLLFSHGLLHPG